MGYDTNYLGYLTVTPSLNRAEVEWLSGFADWGALTDDDPFGLPMNPRAALAAAFTEAGGALPGSSRVPSGVRDWRFGLEGDVLSWRRGEKSNDAIQTIEYLVTHYLGPGALARCCGRPEFDDFTFDHRLDGIIAGERHDTGELFLVRVDDSQITLQTLVAGLDPGLQYVVSTALAKERERRRRWSRRRPEEVRPTPPRR